MLIFGNDTKKDYRPHDEYNFDICSFFQRSTFAYHGAMRFLHIAYVKAYLGLYESQSCLHTVLC